MGSSRMEFLGELHGKGSGIIERNGALQESVLSAEESRAEKRDWAFPGPVKFIQFQAMQTKAAKSQPRAEECAKEVFLSV